VQSMLKPSLVTGPTDNSPFTDLVARIVGGAAAIYKPDDLRIFMIDGRFDYKWLRFSGKAIGAVGVWNSLTTVPPFVKNRLVWQAQYLRAFGRNGAGHVGGCFH
jgi:hypothetical protein